MSKIYIGNLFTSDDNKEEKQKCCYENKIYAIGWELNKKPASIDEYENIAKNVEDWKDDVGLTKAINAMRKIEIGDFIWSRCSETGKYWLGKVTKDASSNFFYMCDNKYCLCVSCEWKECNSDEVPGKILNSFRGGTIKKSTASKYIADYCEFIHSKKSGITLNKDAIKELLHYDDEEDLLGLYLQKEKDLLLYPSTNKMGTAAYEYMLIDKNSKYKAIVQCKMGYDNIYLEPLLDYKDFQIYCVTDQGIVCNNRIEKKKYDKFPNTNIHYKSLDELLIWAKKNKNILPDRIKNYLDITGY